MNTMQRLALLASALLLTPAAASLGEAVISVDSPQREVTEDIANNGYREQAATSESAEAEAETMRTLFVKISEERLRRLDDEIRKLSAQLAENFHAGDMQDMRLDFLRIRAESQLESARDELDIARRAPWDVWQTPRARTEVSLAALSTTVAQIHQGLATKR